MTLQGFQPYSKEASEILPRLLSAVHRPSTHVPESEEILLGLVEKYGANRSSLTVFLRDFFNRHSRRWYLISDVRREVLCMVVDCIKANPRSDYVWALGEFEPVETQAGSFDALAEKLSAQEIGTFCEYAAELIERQCNRDVVLRPDMTRYPGRITKDSFSSRSGLQEYNELAHRDFELVNYALFPSLQHFVELLIRFRLDHIGEYFKRWDHPVVRACAGIIFGSVARKRDFRSTLDYVIDEAPDALIAASLTETLYTISTLDQEAAQFERKLPGKVFLQTNLQPDEGRHGEKAVELVARLPETVSSLAPPLQARWFGELLSEMEYVLPRGPRVEELESACEKAIGEKLPSLDVDAARAYVEVLLTNLNLPPRNTTSRHLAPIAKAVSDRSSSLSEWIWTRLLDDYKTKVSGETLFFRLEERHGKIWTESIIEGVLSLTLQSKIQPDRWFREMLSTMPTTPWDVEEDSSRFISSRQNVCHLLIVMEVAYAWLLESDRERWLPEASCAANAVVGYWEVCSDADVARSEVVLNQCLENLAGLLSDIGGEQEIAAFSRFRWDVGNSWPCMMGMAEKSRSPELRQEILGVLQQHFFETMDSQAPQGLRIWARFLMKHGQPSLAAKACERMELEIVQPAEPSDILLFLDVLLAQMRAENPEYRNTIWPRVATLWEKVWRYRPTDFLAEERARLTEGFRSLGYQM